MQRCDNKLLSALVLSDGTADGTPMARPIGMAMVEPAVPPVRIAACDL